MDLFSNSRQQQNEDERYDKQKTNAIRDGPSSLFSSAIWSQFSLEKFGNENILFLILCLRIAIFLPTQFENC